MTAAEWVVAAVEIYAFAGLLFAAVFVWRGVEKIDPSARNTGLGFRLILLPGSAALWPLLLSRWARGASHPPIENNPHRRLTSKGAP